jgi:hypothetical protein
MSTYYGDFLAGKTIRIRFNTAASGVPTTLTGATATVTKDGVDVTPSGGVTLTPDVGTVTGRNNVVVDMSVDTATFTAGSEYSVRLSGSSNVGGTSWVGVVVGEWSVANRSVAIDSAGVTNASIVKFAGVPVFAYDGILAGATNATITFPTTDVAGNTILDDGRYQFTGLEIAEGTTGGGQLIVVTTRTTNPRQYNVVPATMPVVCDNTSKYILRGSTLAELDLNQPVPLTNTAHTMGDALNAARAQGFGKWTWPTGSTTVTLYAADGITAVHTFAVDSATTPRNRT